MKRLLCSLIVITMLAPVQVLADEDSTGVDEKNNTNVNIEMQGGDLTFDLEKNEGEKSFEAIELEELRSEEHTSELQSRGHLVCRLLLEKKKKKEGVKRFH